MFQSLNRSGGAVPIRVAGDLLLEKQAVTE